jgi:hypothetical protein
MQASARFARLAPRPKQVESQVERDELLSKLDLIEEQARLTLNEFPQHLAKERQRMIIALIKHIRWAISDTPGAADGPETTVRLPL